MWREMSGSALIQYVQNSLNPIHVFFYSPTCGNCKVARRTLDYTLAHHSAMENTGVIACNLNFAPRLAVQWEIERIPALVRVHRGKVTDKRYDFGAIPPLLAWLTNPTIDRA